MNAARVHGHWVKNRTPWNCFTCTRPVPWNTTCKWCKIKTQEVNRNYVCYDIDNIMHILPQVGNPLITVHEQVGDFKFDKSCQLGYVCIWQGSVCVPVCCVQWSHLSERPIPPSEPECTGGSGISHDRHAAWGRGVTGQGQLWWECQVLVHGWNKGLAWESQCRYPSLDVA